MERYLDYLKKNRILPALLILIFSSEIYYYNLGKDMVILFLFVLTSISIGLFIPSSWLSEKHILPRMILGSAFIGYLIWAISFIHPNYNAFLTLLGFFSIIIQRKKLYSIIEYTRSTDNVIKYLSIFVFLGLIPFSVQPIQQYDALVKHFVIPNQMINGNGLNFNVVQSLTLGESSLFPHMLFAYFMAFSSAKGMTLIVTLFSVINGILLYKIANKNLETKLNGVMVLLLYISTPIVFQLSTILYVDIFPITFILLSIYLLINTKVVGTNRYVLIMTSLGFAVFSKITSVIYVLPIILFCVYEFLKNGIAAKSSLNEYIIATIKSAIAFIVPFIFSMVYLFIITGNPIFPAMNDFFGSKYFPFDNFKDPFNNVLGFNLKSLFSIVFETANNVELRNGGVGYAILLILLFPIFAISKKHRLLLKQTNYIALGLLALSIVGYKLALFYGYNIRYFIFSIILIYPAIGILFLGTPSARNKNVQLAILSLLTVSIIIPNLIYLRMYMIPPQLLTMNEAAINTLNDEILNPINKKNVRVLSVHDEFIGDFTGSYYGMHWYNYFLLKYAETHQVSELEFLQNFDYLLEMKQPKRDSYPYAIMLNSSNITLRPYINLVSEDENYRLFKILSNDEILLSKNFETPILVNAQKPENISFKKEHSEYQITIETSSAKEGLSGRWQINWYDKNGNMVDCSLTPFPISGPKFEKYISSWFTIKSDNINQGVLFLTSHSEDPILIKSYEVKVRGGDSTKLIDQLEKEVRFSERLKQLVNVFK